MRHFQFSRALTFTTALIAMVYATNTSFSQTKKTVARAAEKDSVWVILNHVRAGKQEVFEKFVHEIFFDKASKLPPREQQVFRQTRILHPTKAEDDGSYVYCFIMDPVVPNADYEIGSLLKKIYGDAEGDKQMMLFQEAVLKQTGYMLTQSRH